MRAFRLFALAAALVASAAAAHAQYGVYVGPQPGYAVPYNDGWVPGHWEVGYYGQFWVPGHRVEEYGRGGWSRERHEWRRDHDEDRDRGRGWDRDHYRDYDRR